MISISTIINLVIAIVSCNYWIRDWIREYTSTYMSITILLSVAFIGVMSSEILFFNTLFWSWFQPFCSYLHSLEGVYYSDPTVISYINTVILSNCGISLGCTLIIRDVYSCNFLFHIYVWGVALTFLYLQTNEFLNITLYMNDTINISWFFTLLVLHLCHIIVGIILNSISVWNYSYNRSILNFTLIYLIVIPHLTFYTLLIIYWHFVDVLWLLIFYVLYN